jgi:glycosyltransferase involved in cell wall biosynthesis
MARKRIIQNLTNASSTTTVATIGKEIASMPITAELVSSERTDVVLDAPTRLEINGVAAAQNRAKVGQKLNGDGADISDEVTQSKASAGVVGEALLAQQVLLEMATAEAALTLSETDDILSLEELPGSASSPTADVMQNGEVTSSKPRFRCHIDEISAGNVEGWLMAPDHPSQHFVVVLKEGNQVHARARASRFREDLVSAGIGDGCYAFQLSFPRTLLDGAEHLLEFVEEETSFRLTDEPLRWRSATVSDARTPSHERPVETMAESLTAPRNYAHSPVPVDARVLFDISDLIYYIGHHANLTGIQRVQSSIVLSVLKNELLPQSDLIFLSFDARNRSWVLIPTGFLSSLLTDLLLPESQRLVRFNAEEARYGILPGASHFDGNGVLDDGYPSVLCLLGAAWVNQDYLHRVLALKRQFGTRFVMTVHDLIPIYARETCDQDTVRVFEAFMRRALRHADHILSVSENTADDIRRYTSSLQIPTPPITVTRNGSSFAEFLTENRHSQGRLLRELPDRFVLFVATIEGRKNHQLVLDIWRQMLADGDDPPALVCVGRLGWKSSAFVSTLVETDYLDGRVILLREISDTDLRALYERCLFTVCPTFYEGWGLPVGEALSLGKICVCSDRASIPEVAGEFGVYIDIDDINASKKAIRGLIASDVARKRLEDKIRHGYKFITWRSVAERVIEACRTAPNIKWTQPYPYTAIPYSTEISFARLDRSEDSIGELLLTRIAGNRQGLFLSDPLTEQSFLRGDEARSGGHWAYPEDWGAWACHAGAEIALGLAPHDSVTYYAFVRLRASGPAMDQPVRLYANDEELWEDAIGPRPRTVMLRVRRRATGNNGWHLKIRAEIDLPEEKRTELAAVDSRIPTIGFERMMIVPENDLKTRLDMLYTLLL